MRSPWTGDGVMLIATLPAFGTRHLLRPDGLALEHAAINRERAACDV
ncbi:MAG: hypothetical protein V7K25_30185 [Nostoc sp.]